MKCMWIRIILYGCCVLFLAACDTVGAPMLPNEGTAIPASPPMVAETQTESGMTQPTLIPGMELLIEKARQDLAQRLSIPETRIKLVEATPVVWPDASLGCPQPGMKYIQVPEDGLLIRLQVDEQIYRYHSGGSREPFLCEQAGKDPNRLPPIDILTLTPSGPKSTPGSPTTPDNSIPPGEDQ